MLELLQFIFSSFWIWAGTILLIVAVLQGITEIMKPYFAAKQSRFLQKSTEEYLDYLNTAKKAYDKEKELKKEK